MQERAHVVMVTFNGVSYTKIALKSLIESTEVPFRFTIVDNGSSDGTIEYIHQNKLDENKLISFNFIQSEENLGYGGAIMKALENDESEFVCMANNDIIFEDGWLKRMQDVMDRNPDIALLGPLSPVQWCRHPYSQDNTRKVMADISEDVSIEKELEMYCKSKSYSIFLKDVKQLNDFGLRYFGGPPSHIMGFLSLARMSSVKEVGKLIEPDYHFGSDDTDLSWRLSLHGYKLAVTSNVYIHHFKHRSFVENKQDHKSIFLKINQAFFNKWKDEIYNFINENIDQGVDVDEKMQGEESYEFWVLRRLNETFGFWKNGKLIKV